MANDLNLVLFTGNLGRDPELRYTPSGAATCQFTVASNRSWQKDGEWQEATEWFNVVAWRDLAERVNRSLSKGAKVLVQGRLETRSWDAQDGTKKYRTEVVADRVQVLGKPNGGRGDDYGGEEPGVHDLPI